MSRYQNPASDWQQGHERPFLMDIFQTEAAAHSPGDQAERRHEDNDHDAERVEPGVLARFVEVEDQHRHHLGSRVTEENRQREHLEVQGPRIFKAPLCSCCCRSSEDI